jgi:outer membrane autotransporter protein
MKGTTKHGGHTRGTPAATPIARAIRNALAVSATALALSMPAVGFAAGTCSFDAGTNTYVCNGDFTQTVPDSGFVPPADLTLVLGDEAPASVTPASGDIGVDAAWSGNVSVITGADTDIGSSGADGLRAYSADAMASVANYGSIHADVTAADAEAMRVYALYDVTVVNGGDVFAGDASGNYDVVAAGISSISGYSAGFDNLAGASITASAYGGSATAISADASGYYATAGISNEGVIDADSVNGDASGIVAQAVTGYAMVGNSGSVDVSGHDHATGIYAYGGYSASIYNSGDIQANADGGTVYSTVYGASSVSAHRAYLTNGADGRIDASIHAQSGDAVAATAYVYGHETATLDNYGVIDASAVSDDGGALAFAGVVNGSYAGIGLLINGGDLDAQATAGMGGTADARGAYVYGNVASIFNDASSSAVAISDGGTATAKGARASGSYTAISNYGELSASASADGGSADARGAESAGYLGSQIYNAGDIHADATAAGGAAGATGSYSLGYRYGSSTDNQGDIVAVATGDNAVGVGAFNVSPYVGDAVISNEGSIDASAQGTLQASAYGIYNYAWVYDAVVDNSGSVHASASAAANGDNVQYVNAIGVVDVNSSGYYGVSVVNSGDIEASASAYYGVPRAWGVAMTSGGAAALSLENESSISAYGHVELGQTVATGAYLSTVGGTLQIVNNGDIASTARAERGVGYLTDYAYATAITAKSLPYSYDSATVINNYATIEVEASVDGGIAGAIAINALGLNVSITNAEGATISSTGHTDLFGGGFASGIEANGVYGVDVVNNGTIDVYGHANSYAVGPHTYYGASRANAIYAAAGTQGNVSVVNNGDIVARAISEHGTIWAAGGAGATGIQTYAKYDAVVDNSGSVAAIASSELGNVSAYGASVHGKYYSHLINDAGASIEASASVGSLAGDAYGGRVVSFGTEMFGATYATTYNAGSIVSHATSTPPAGDPAVVPGLAIAYGSVVGNVNWSSIDHGSIVNLGDIEAVAQADGGYATSYGTMLVAQYDVELSNSGSILSGARADAGSAFAVGSVSSSVHTYYSVPCSYDNGYRQCDYANATHVVDGGKATVDNTGSIAVSARAHGGDAQAYGVVSIGGIEVGITNAGDISGSVDADDAMVVATLVNSYMGHAALQNSGTIGAYAVGSKASATGASVLGTHGDSGNAYPEITFANLGEITATAKGDDATAIGAVMAGRDTGDVEIGNDGKIAATAEGRQAAATAVSADAVGNIALGNTGNVTASATGDVATATAITAVSHAGDGVQVDNGKTVSAAAYGVHGAATALSMDAYGSVVLSNGGSIAALSRGDGAIGVKAVSSHDDGMQIGNTGTIAAMADGTDGVATALSTSSYGGLTLTNGGSITASSKGDSATGVEAISSHGDGVRIDNAGTIAAVAYGSAASVTAISMASRGTATLHNTGTIAALGSGARIAIASGKDASASIFNGGSIAGAIDTGGMDDSFENAVGATWHLAGSSDFGAGDDHIVNHGTMYMQDAQILLGGYTGGNTFENSGTIVVAGSANVIDMDNPFPIVNNGVIDLANGRSGEVLTLVGDLDGTGSIELDASGLNGNMDQLDIQGRVFDTARQTLDINLLDLPTAAKAEIPLLQASGNVDGGFALGDVRYLPGSFLTRDVSLHSSVDPQDAARRLLSLEVDITGLNRVGSTIAAIAPGVQSLVDAQVGTWRQRVGVVPESNDARLSPWVRTFSGSGDVDLGHAGNFGGGGTFGFRQSNHGLELGIDTRLSEHLNAGMLIGKSEGRQNLRDGAGSDRFDSRAVGFYATWRAGKGFYLDLSQRWNSVDAKLRSGAVNHMTGASASTFNVESGFTAWKLGRVNIVPQAQYTRTRVEDIDPLQEGSSRLAYNGGASSRGRLGVTIDGSFLGAGFVWTPYGSANVVRAFSSNYGYLVNDGVLGSVDTEGTSTMVEAGLGVRKGKLSLTGGVSRTDGGALRTVTGAQFTVRYDW